MGCGEQVERVRESAFGSRAGIVGGTGRTKESGAEACEQAICAVKDVLGIHCCRTAVCRKKKEGDRCAATSSHGHEVSGAAAAGANGSPRVAGRISMMRRGAPQFGQRWAEASAELAAVSASAVWVTETVSGVAAGPTPSRSRLRVSFSWRRRLAVIP